MTITAKFPGRCAACQNSIDVGSPIEWDRDTKQTWHAACAPKKTAAPAAPARPATGFQPTTEQAEALRLFATGENLAIEAGAGTGKTSTLRLLAESTNRRGQYIAFNKAIVQESKAKFPKTVACSTAHSLAYRACPENLLERLHGSRRMRSLEIAQMLGVTSFRAGDKLISASYLGGYVMSAVTRFCQSADLEPTYRHFPYIEGIDTVEDGVRSWAVNNAVAKAMVPALRKAWADLMSENGALPFRHDHYLKRWQLNDPKIPVDYILFDEAQDANPVMVAIVTAQDEHAQLVWVGDSQQQIYEFTGAVNALQTVPADNRAFLTQSFRFGPRVADQANVVLANLDAELRIVGTPTIPSRVEIIQDTPDAILTRTNAAAVRTVLEMQRAGLKVALVGGGDEIVRFARAANELMEEGHTEHPDLACFDTWAEVISYVEEDAQGGELELLVKLITDFGVPTILAALDKTIREEHADVIVSTAHKSKGREWDRVQLAGDFPVDNPSDSEMRLLYVACTRAKLILDIDAVAVLREAALLDRDPTEGYVL